MPRTRVHAERIPAPPTWIVKLDGEHDLATSGVVAETIGRVLPDGVPVVVDLSGVTFAESAILGVLLQTRQDAAGRRVAVVATPGSQPDRLFDLVDARSLLHVFPAREAALAWCHAAQTGADGPHLRLDEPA